ncbi:MAG: GNAT family N-acetyltransferase [Spirochaetaceae bacterium]|jgi:Leu/Phe-tRNA-protein transferase|nr:GNAT family N-acetyltransferase [Spirochaetaceae bacterium]
MDALHLRFTPTGYVVIFPQDNLDRTIDALLDINYAEEFCLASDFEPVFITHLMAAGFLVMSTKVEEESSDAEEDENSGYLLLPKLHLTRSVLFFGDLHVKKSLKSLLSRYKLEVDRDFERIMNRCVEIHGDDWLTAPLRENIRLIRGLNNSPVRPVSFGVYRDGELKAGEFGVVAGRVYTSYSGYYDEDNAGTVQMVLMTQYLKDAGFAFLDLGMPLDYKDALGARNIDPRYFVDLFRDARGKEGFGPFSAP